ncbi:MAG: succinate dehydrogenase assembly factor 2 [Gammaproteobacteria bacterium]|nr:succinate dehydrogenase assembly factor 2 [Gammaproteobacteria bacterium]
MMPASSDDSALRWRCRRGMLELDIILNEFLDKSYNTISDEQRCLLDQMLDYPDQLLFDLFLANIQSSDKGISELVTTIRQSLTA